MPELHVIRPGKNNHSRQGIRPADPEWSRRVSPGADENGRDLLAAVCMCPAFPFLGGTRGGAGAYATHMLNANSIASNPINRMLKIVQARSNTLFFPQ
jgi:hypothetical protein